MRTTDSAGTRRAAEGRCLTVDALSLPINISRYVPRSEQPIPTRADRRRHPHRGKSRDIGRGCRAHLACDCRIRAICLLRRGRHGILNYPWCIIGDDRGIDCVFSSRRNVLRTDGIGGLPGQCILCLILAAAFHAGAADETLKFRTISVQLRTSATLMGPLHGAGIVF
jgi:hypothetical protein